MGAQELGLINYSKEAFTTRQLAEAIGRKPATLDIWRHRNQGPPWVKVGGTIYYMKTDVKKWHDKQVNASPQ